MLLPKAALEAREGALIERLREQGEEAKREVEAATTRALEAMEAMEGRAREVREAAVEECNSHWLGVVAQQSEAHARRIEAVEGRAREVLAEQARKVEGMEEARAREVAEASLKLRQVQEAVAKATREEVEEAGRRQEQSWRQSIGRVVGEMEARLEGERRRWEAQLDEAYEAGRKEGRRAGEAEAKASQVAVAEAEARVGAMGALVERERGEHEAALSGLRKEMERVHTAEMGEQHAWYARQIQEMEKVCSQVNNMRVATPSTPLPPSVGSQRGPCASPIMLSCPPPILTCNTIRRHHSSLLQTNGMPA